MSTDATTKTTVTSTENKRTRKPRGEAKNGEAKRVRKPKAEAKPKVKKEAKPKTKDFSEFYKKYPWVVKNSVHAPTAEDVKNLKKCHGTVCTIKCVDSGKLRTINTQDAFQVKRTEEAQKVFQRKQRAMNKKAKQKKPEKKVDAAPSLKMSTTVSDLMKNS